MKKASNPPPPPGLLRPQVPPAPPRPPAEIHYIEVPQSVEETLRAYREHLDWINKQVAIAFGLMRREL